MFFGMHHHGNALGIAPGFGSVLLAALLLLSAPPGIADDSPVELVADETWQPFIDAELPEGGLITELVVEAFEQAGRGARVTYRPWSRALDATARGDYDAIAGAYFSDARAERFIYSREFLRFRVSLIARRDSTVGDYEQLSDLRQYRIGIIRDAAYPDELFDSGLEIHRSSTREGLVRMLQTGRVDLMADTRELFRHHALQAGINPDDFIALSPPLRDEDLFVIAPRLQPGSQALIEDFDRGLEELRASGRYLEIRRKYGF